MECERMNWMGSREMNEKGFIRKENEEWMWTRKKLEQKGHQWGNNI